METDASSEPDGASRRGHARLRVLLASSTSWPASAKLAAAFLRHGCEVDVVCAGDHPFRFLCGLHRVYRYRALASLRSLSAAMLASAPDLVVACDDGVVRQMHELHQSEPGHRALIERSLGAPEGYDIVTCRARFMRVAQELGLRAPATTEIRERADLRRWFAANDGGAALKAEDSFAGKGVWIVRSLAEAERAMRALSRAPGLLHAAGRWFALHDTLSLSAWSLRRPRALTMQRFVKGTPANLMMACRDGKVLATVSVEVLWSERETGPASVVRIIENAEMRVAAERLAQRLHLSGFHGLDFMLEPETERAHLIEINPRCTQLGHLLLPGQGDLAGALCAAMSGTASLAPRRAMAHRTIAFFPQVLFTEGASLPLEDAFIDAPWEQPELVREMARMDWRNRLWLARLYNLVRSPKRKMVKTARATVKAARSTAVAARFSAGRPVQRVNGLSPSALANVIAIKDSVARKMRRPSP